MAEAQRQWRLLITSVGSLVGHNVLEGLVGLREHFFVVGLNSQADAASNFLCDRVHLGPPLEAGADFERCFDALVDREAPDLIIPGRDDDVVFLAQWAEQRAALRAPVMVGSAAMATLMRDKWLSAQFARAHGLPFAPTLCAEDGRAAVDGLAARQGWPLIAKPRTGNASRGVVLVGGPGELDVAFGWPGYCFQAWLGLRPDVGAIRRSLQGGLPLDWSLPGIEKASLDGCIGPDGRLLAPFATLHSELRMGRTERVQRIVCPTLDDILRRYAQVLGAQGWRGPFNIQLGRTDAGEWLAFELNGRFTGSAATLSALGLEFVPEAIAAFVGALPAHAILTPVTRVDKRLRNWPMPAECIDQLLKTGVWERAA